MNESAAIRDEKAFVKLQKDLILKISTKKDLAAFLALRITTPNSIFLYGEADSDQDEPEKFDYLISSKLMSLPDKNYYTDKKIMADFEQVIAKLFESIGDTDSKQKAKIIVELERKFAAKYPDASIIRKRGAQDTYWTREKWLQTYSYLPLNVIFERLPPSIRIRNKISEAVAVTNDIIRSSSLDDIKAYILYSTIKDRLDDGFPDYFKTKFEFENKYFGGPAERFPRGEQCTRLVMNNFSFEVDAELIPILFKDFPKDQVRQLVEQIRKALLEQLNENIWLSKEAKARAIQKMKSAALSVATPEQIEDWNFRPVLTYSEQQPLQNQLRLEQAILDQVFERMQKPKNRNIWYLSPLTFNSYYVPGDNRLSILLGILQPPYFDSQQTMIENLAAIGQMAGHELGHGIDDKGSLYDENGRLKSWMSKKDSIEFKKRAEKFKKRFDQIGHDGALTLGENIADHMGLRAAYLASFPKIEASKQEDQRKFFVAYAKAFCEVNRPDFEKVILKTDNHALGRARINEQVVHLEGFHQAFSCKPGDQMYRAPSDRFQVW